MTVLTINCGSSTLKFQLLRVTPGRTAGVSADSLARGGVDRVGGGGRFEAAVSGGVPVRETYAGDHADATRRVFDWLRGAGLLDDLEAVGHRVVHGGDRFATPAVIDDEVLRAVEAVSDLAPLHNRPALAAIHAARAALGGRVPMVAVFDTAFPRTLPPRAAHYAIPSELAEKHSVRRYGFHGIAHRYMAERYAELAGPSARLVTLQLGNGCSAAAVDGGRCVDTSMGFSPLEGLMMGTRSGDIDPSVVGYLAAREGVGPADVEGWLNTRSGLLGVSGRSPDMRDLLRAEAGGDARAALAVEMFCYRVRKCVGAYLAALGGADAVVFGGGIGENSPAVRDRVCAEMAWCGLRLDPHANAAAVGNEGRISPDGATIHAFVIPVDESIVIARDTLGCLTTRE
jgi:acetate kinase